MYNLKKYSLSTFLLSFDLVFFILLILQLTIYRKFLNVLDVKKNKNNINL